MRIKITSAIYNKGKIDCGDTPFKGYEMGYSFHNPELEEDIFMFIGGMIWQ